MLKSIKNGAVLLLGLGMIIAGTSTAQAAIFDQGIHTFDDSTNLLWLDLTETIAQSYNTINTRISTGGDLEGYRFATGDEFSQLVVNFGLPAGTNLSGANLLDGANEAAWTNMKTLLGHILINDDTYMYGFVNTGTPGDYRQSIDFLNSSRFTPDILNKEFNYGFLDFQLTLLGAYLVKTAPNMNPVNEPAYLGLLGFGAVMAGYMTTRRKRG